MNQTTHLNREDFQQWLDFGAEQDRERVVGHLSACDTCGAAYRDLLLEQEAQTSKEAAREFIEAGYRLGPQTSRRSLPAELSRRTWLATAASLAILGFALVAYYGARQSPTEHGGSGGITRGIELAALAPSGEVAMPGEFEWSPVGARVLVEVFDERRTLVYRVTLDRSPAAFPEELSTKLVPGESYQWMVTRVDTRGQSFESSGLNRFVVAGPE